MDLPEESPAGGQYTPVSTGDRSSVRDFSAGTPAVEAGSSTHRPQDPGILYKFAHLRRNRLVRNVLRIRLDADGANRTGKASSPDAQGQETMTTRNTLTSVAAIAGFGLMTLTLHACGQKPAPAEEAATTAAAS